MKFLKTFSGLMASAFLFVSLPVSAADQYQKMRDEVITMVNEQRAVYGAAELYEADLLNQAAQIRAEEIANDFSHLRPDGRAADTAFTDLGGTYYAIGENIAFGFSTEDAVMNGWMNSEGHRNNILNTSFKAIGVGVCVTGSSTYWVQMFSDGIGLNPLYTTGDVNSDQIINAQDAVEILKDAAETGAGNDGTLSRMQRSYADVNQDGYVNAVDAAIILRYAAYAGSGGTESFEVFRN